MTEGFAHTAVFTIDSAGTVLDVDPAAERLFGYARGEALGRRLSELIVPVRLRAAHEAGLHRYLRTGEAPTLQTPFRLPALRRDGTEFEVELVVNRTQRDGVEAFVGLLRPVGGSDATNGELLLRAEFFRTLVERSPDLVVVLDDRGAATYASPSVTALLGVSAGACWAGFVNEAVHPDDRAQAHEATRLAIEGKLTEPFELRVRDLTGGWRALSIQARDLRDHPAVAGTALYATDTTRIRAAERRERLEYTRLMTLVESLKVGVLLQDEHRRVVLTNSAFVEMFELALTAGLDRPAAPRSGPRDYPMAFADPSAASQRVEEVVGRGRPLFGDEVTLLDGQVLERDYVPITLDGSTLGHLWVFRDVTTQAEARRALQERNRVLTELSALKTEFVAVLSHELRTPLTSIATFAGMLDGSAGLDPVEHRTAVGAIRRNVDRMLSLVADLVLLAQLESGELALGRGKVDLAAVVRALAPDQGDVADGPPVAGDENLMRQLFATVFGVVARMNPTVTVETALADGSWVVRINAATTEPVTMERLLSTRLPHPANAHGYRTGALALTLARAIAARHGGNLSTIRAATGVTVAVTLPVAD